MHSDNKPATRTIDSAVSIKTEEQSVDNSLLDKNNRTVDSVQCLTTYLMDKKDDVVIHKIPNNNFKTVNDAAGDVPNDIDLMRNAYSTPKMVMLNNCSKTRHYINQAENTIQETNCLQGPVHECHNTCNEHNFSHGNSLYDTGGICLPHSTQRNGGEHSKTQLISQKNHYVCNYCTKVFKHKPDLQRHIMIHTGEKPHACSRCDKAFIVKRDLQRHFRTHTGEMPYSCNYCDKSFTRKNNLQRHIMMHTGENAYSCNICDKKFRRKDKFQTHTLIHTGEKPYSCSHCDMTFTAKSTLQRHIMMHTGKKPYACNVCDEKFRRKYKLQRHVMSHR